MSFNLPANRLLKLTKGSWADVQYPVTAVVQANLTPRDFFEPVDPNTPRSCVPAGGQGFSYLFDANSGRLTLRGPSMFPPISVTFDINEGSWNVIFVGRLMQLTQTIAAEADVNLLLTHFEHTLPSLLSLVTGLSIFAETLEIALGDKLEARAEIFIPPNDVRVIEADRRIDELRCGIEIIGLALPSARFILACSYVREALFLDAAYNDHNPYTHSLIVILKCAQAIEVLFGGQREAMRKRCRSLGLEDRLIESQIIPIILARNDLGPAHASSFVPNTREVEILRNFSKRSVHTVRQLLLHISHVDPQKRTFLADKLERDPKKEKLLNALEQSLQSPMWCVKGKIEVRHVEIPDPRLG